MATQNNNLSDYDKSNLPNVSKMRFGIVVSQWNDDCLLYTSPSPRDATLSRMPSSA